MNEIRYLLLKQGHKCICPRVHIPGWYECDIFSINRQHQFVEHELKSTVADYKADFGKQKRKQGKHQMLALHNIIGPAYYWFVCDFDPPSLPSYAGWKLHNGLIRKKAPKLHNMKISTNRMIHVANSLSYRFYT